MYLYTEYPPSPVKQSSPLLPEPSMPLPPHTTAIQFLPPYPQSHPSVPYTASRHSVHPPMSPRYNQQPQARHAMPMSVPTANATTRPYLMTPPHARPYVEFNNSPPRHHYYSHTMSFMQQQSPPTAYGSGIYDSGGNTTGSYYLFPPPSSPAHTAVSQGGYEEIHTTLKQIVQQPQAHNPHTVPVTYAKEPAETDRKHKRKSKTTKPATEGAMGSNPSLGDIKQGKPAVKADTNRRQAVSKGRGGTSRDPSSAVGHHGNKHQQSA